MDALEQKIQALAGYPAVGEKLARRFAALIGSASDWELFRVNPLRFAAQHDLAPAQSLDLFVHAARVGLFDFAFNQLCLYCGGVEYSATSLSDMKAGWRCTLCNVDVDGTLDDRLEVSFTMNPSVRQLDIDPFRDVDSYARAFFSENRKHPPEIEAYARAQERGFLLVPPDGRQDVVFEARAGEQVSITSMDTHSRVNMPVVEGGPLEVTLGYHPHGADVTKLELGPGRVTLHAVNYRGTPVAGFVAVNMSEMPKLGMRFPSTWQPFVTGKALLNHQSFRELFRVQSLAPDLKLSLKSLTLLFTDLKGSTELYDRTGDVYAYQVVQEHFRVLSDAVRRHHGAIVKTMGDAIMASFSTAKDAVAAAVEMMAAMEKVNVRLKADGHETGLKVGLHEGPALAVNAESRLDYFGQTVNIAARVQALASSGEIWLTEPVLGADGVGEALARAGYSNERKVVSLKGVGAPTPVFRCVA
jgi:class 3 adenylate cyclase